jgi:flagellar protein FliS
MLSQYQQLQAETTSPGRRILLLFDGMIRFVENALDSHTAQNEDDRRYYVGRAQAILLVLMGTLDVNMAGELGTNLMRLYNYTFDLLSQGDQNGDETSLRQGLSMLRELREAWAEADAIFRRNDAASAPVLPVKNALSLVG